MATIQVEVVTPEKMVMSTTVTSIVLPGSSGEFEVLPGHLPMLATMKAGPMKVRKENGDVETFALGEGFVEVLPDLVTVLAEAAAGEFEIDLDAARKAAQEAKDRLAELESEDEESRYVFQTALERAQSRIDVAEKKQD